ncbi:MAG TPA: hypothetical protein VGY66_28300 [Gemmataceae bacterium]|nr:hypothetical protein [Gemmataceae bacterium]
MWWSLMLGVLAGAGPAPTELAPPVRLLAGGQPINVDIGHAAPFVADLRGDGTMNLLVGQFGEGKLRLYPISGSKDGRSSASLSGSRPAARRPPCRQADASASLHSLWTWMATASATSLPAAGRGNFISSKAKARASSLLR